VKALLDDFTPVGKDVDLTLPLVHVDAVMIHGWPLSSAALTAGCSCGRYATTSSKRPAVSSHLRSVPNRNPGLGHSGRAGRVLDPHVVQSAAKGLESDPNRNSRLEIGQVLARGESWVHSRTSWFKT